MKLQRAFFLVIALVFLVGFTVTVSDRSGVSQSAQVSSATSAQTVRVYSLVNADTDTVIGPLTDGQVIDLGQIGTPRVNIVAETNPAVVGSVAFILDQQARVVRNVPPYTLGSHNNAGNFYAANLSLGSHTLKTQTFTLNRARGLGGEVSEINFTVVGSASNASNTQPETNSGSTTTLLNADTHIVADNVANTSSANGQEVVSFTLVNADTNQDIMNIENGAVINTSDIGTSNVTVRANTIPASVGSVKFHIDSIAGRTDNLFPYTNIANTNTDDYQAWSYMSGQQYSFTATPWTLPRARGVEGTPLTVSFIIIGGAVPVSGPAPQSPGHNLVTSLPAMGCLTATVTNSTNSADSANPGSITVSWPALSGYSKYKVWRILNGNVVDTVENTGTAYTTNYVTPGNWSIKVAFLDPAAALNSGGDWGPEAIVSNLMVGVGIPAATVSSCTNNTTTDASITVPTANYVTVGQPFTFTVEGTPSSAQISSVTFRATALGAGTIYPTGVSFGTDSQPPYTVQANIPVKGIYTLHARVALTNGQVLNKRKQVFVTNYAITPNSGTPTFNITNAGFENQISAYLTEDVPYTVNYNTTLPNGVQFMGAEVRAWGGDPSWPGTQGWNGAGLTPVLATIPASAPSGSFQVTIPEPGTGVGAPPITNVLVVTSYFSNTVNTDNYRLSVSANPNEGATTSISSIQLVRSDGAVISTLPTGSATTINIGTQNGGIGTNFAVKANANPATVGSVRFALDGTVVSTENAAPYSMHGDTGGTNPVYTFWPNIPMGAHTIRVTPYSASGGGGTAGTFQEVQLNIVNNDTVAPAAPTGLSVNYRSAGEIRLSWNASAGATSYKIYRTGTGATYGPQTATTFTDTSGLTLTGAFSYQVTAINAGGQESAVSTSVSAPTLSTVHSVGALVAPNANNTQVRNLPESATPLIGTVGTTNNGSIVAGPVWVTGGTQYWRTTFTNPALSGPGWVDQTRLSTYVAPTAPAAPTNFTGTGSSTSQINLTWTDNATNETGYEVQRAASTDTGFASPTNTTYAPNANSASITTGLTAGTSYLFRIRAVNSASGLNSAWVNSSPASISTQVAQTTPNTPTNFAGSATSPTSINISWTDNANNETGFVLNRATAPDFSSGFVTTNISANTSTAPSAVNYSVTGLAPSTTYYFQLKATNASGDSAWATPVSLSVTTPQNTQVIGQEDVPCVPPNYSNVYAAPISTWGVSPYTGGTNKSVQLSSGYSTMNSSDPFIRLCWTTIPGRTVTSNITIKRREIGDTNASWTTLTSTLPGTSTSYENHGVSLGVAYEYSVSFTQNSNATYNSSTYATNGQADGYIATGIRASLPAYNGKIILVIDSTFQGSLADRISTLTNDLNGDRWQVQTIYVSRTATPASVRSQIKAIYDAEPTNVKAAYLVGHVPVALLSSLNPDGHAGRAMSSDLYYADMNETWSQSGCSLGTAQGASFASGEWDASKMFCKTDVTPELQVGRIDMSNLTGGNELSLLQGYLDRMHEMKVKNFTPNESAIMVGVFGFDDSATGPGAQESAKKLVTRDFWNDIPSLVGSSIQRHLDTTFVSGNNMFAFYGLNDGGACTRTTASSGEVSWSTINANSSGWNNVFNSFSPSYLGEWNCNDSLLRATLAKGRGANSWYHISRHTYLHQMGMGRNIGFSFRKTVAENNGATSYSPVAGWGTDYTPATNNGYQSLLGDPTMRMAYVNMPGALTVTGTAGGPATFIWAAATGSPDGYNIYKFSSNSITRIATQVTGTSYTGDTFASGVKYMVTAVKNKTSASGGKYWNESLGSIYTTTGGGGGDVLAPSAPSNLAVSGTTANTVSLSWTASVGNPAGEAITYKVLRSSSTNGTYTQTGSSTTSTTFTDSGLTAGTTYYYRVIASDAASNTSAPAPSATTGASATPVDTQAPSAPAGLMSTGQTISSITLTWNASTGNPAGEAVTYKVFRSTTANGTYAQTGSSTTSTTFTDSGLTAGTTYYYKVSATDASNNSSAQNPSTGYGAATSAQADTQPPTVPTGLTVTATTASSISLSWNASTDVGGSVVQGYLIYRSATSGGAYDTIGNSSGTSYTDSGLAPNTTYYYKITAIDNSPNGNQSAQTQYVSGTTSVVTGGGSGQVLGLAGVYAGPNNSEDVTPGANPAGVTDFFVDCAAGNDSNNGTSAATAWRTLSKFNASGAGQMLPGSRAFFKRGCTFYKTDVYPMGDYDGGVVQAYKSGTASNYIEYKAYGSGAAPVISGAVPVTGWSLYQGNIYKANIGTNKKVRYLFANNNIQTIARTPNKDANGNSVYMKTDNITNPGGLYLNVSDTSTTNGSMPNSSAVNLVGGEYSARYVNWAYVVAPITAHSGQQITINLPNVSQVPCYTPNCTESIYPAAGWGYFVQNKLALLDTAGEWYYDNATGDVYLWAPGGVNPSTMTVEVAVHKRGIQLANNVHHVKIKNLAFEKFNKFSYGGSDKGSAIFIQDYTGAPGALSNIVENVEIKYSPIGVRVESDVTNASNGNKVLNSYIHDIFDIGAVSYGVGHLFQGNVIENVALQPELAADTDEWNHMYGFVSTGGNTDFISNIVRNIGYIGINYVENGEIRGNLVENISLTLNDGCGICADGAENDLTVKRNVVNHVYGNINGLPSTFIHATALGSGVSTGDRNSIGGIFEENVVNDAGNSGITFDNNTFSQNMVMRNNTIYTNQPGNSNGAKGISMYDQSVGVYHPGENNSSTLYDFDLGHSVYGNKVYTLHQNNNSLYEVRVAPTTNGTYTDFGDYWGNYFFHPYSTNTIVNYRPAPLVTTGDLIWTLTNAPVYSSATTNTSSGTVPSGTKGYISGTESNNRWFVTFNNGQSGWMRSYEIGMAKKNIAEFQQVYNQPPSGQPQNTQRGVGDSLPTLYVNTTGAAMSANIGSGKCGSNGQPLANPYPLNSFADAIVPEICSEQ